LYFDVVGLERERGLEERERKRVGKVREGGAGGGRRHGLPRLRFYHRGGEFFCFAFKIAFRDEKLSHPCSQTVFKLDRASSPNIL
jgi:hypothetical protein